MQCNKAIAALVIRMCSRERKKADPYLYFFLDSRTNLVSREKIKEVYSVPEVAKDIGWQGKVVGGDDAV